MPTLAKIIVTTALIYANGPVHLGHITSTYLPADIFVRFCRLREEDVIHVGATDDYGTPILVEAERQGVNPKEFVSSWNKKDQQDFSDMGITFDIFDKTSSKENIELTQHFFRKLNEKGYITKRKVSQPYCHNCKKFLPDRYIKGTCPNPKCKAPDQYSDSCEECGKSFEPGEILDPYCSICKSRPVERESEHYFFRLSQFSERLEKWLTLNQNLQPEVKNYVLNWVKEGLRDWDISRNLPWGIPVPLKEAEGKVLYVWFNNHIGYISSAMKYFAGKGIDGKNAWNSSTIYHFIGKDIAYHHYLYLPAMRIGVNEYKLPDYIPTRGYFTLEGRKFSKSREWFISVSDFLEKFPPDYLRYYLAAITPYNQSDVDFNWTEFQSRINNELIANIGNFMHRVLTFIWSNYKGLIPEPADFDDLDKKFIEKLNSSHMSITNELENIQTNKALRKILELSTFCNQYLQQKAPWKNKERAGTTLFLCANTVRTLAILVEPFIPFSAERIWYHLNLDGEVHDQVWNTATTLKISAGHRIVKPEIIFEKIEDSVLDSMSN